MKTFLRKAVAKKAASRRQSIQLALEQLQFVFEKLNRKASGILPNLHPELGDPVAIDGSLITATFPVHWANYRKGSKKAKIYLGFDLNHAIPSKIFFPDGKGAERPFVGRIISPGETAAADRGYQEHALFDSLQADDKSFVIRIKAKTAKPMVQKNESKT